MRPYYILLSPSVLTLITKSFKILETKRAFSFQKLRAGRRKVQLSLYGKLMVHNTHCSTKKMSCCQKGKYQIAEPFYKQTSRRQEEQSGIRSKDFRLPEEALLLPSGIMYQQWSEAGNSPTLNTTKQSSSSLGFSSQLEGPSHSSLHKLPSISHPFCLGSWKSCHFGFGHLLPKSSSQERER